MFLRLLLVCAGLLTGKGADAAPVALQAEPFPLERTRLLEGPFLAAQRINARYLLEEVDPDRLLAGFRAQAGRPANAPSYGGWETRLGGHSLGHYLSALAGLYAATGETGARLRIDIIVAELAACQAANGDGYVLPVNKSVYEDLRVGRIRAAGFSLNREWMPNYVLHKVLAGLRDAYRLAGNQQALEVERRLADYLAGIYQKITPVQAQEILRAEFGGMNEVLADLTVDTGDPSYLKLAETVFHHDAVLGPLEAGRDELDGAHANTQIPKIVGLARHYLLTGDPRARVGVRTFWDSVVYRRSFANGGHGEGECFFPPYQFPKKPGPQTAETCGTYNMIKLSGLLFSWEPRANVMDFVERGLLNHVLANIGREPGEFGYFLPLGEIAHKSFSTASDSWWCCVGTGMESATRYAEQAYFHHDDTLWVNLYLASRLEWLERGVVLSQETAFPDGDSMRFTINVKRPTRFTLKLRHPCWCENPEVAINGKPVAASSTPSSYQSFSREWSDGDTVDLRLPMTLRTEPLPHSEGKTVALMYGPLQLVALVSPAPEEEDPAKLRYADHLKSPGRVAGEVPALVAEDAYSLLAAMQVDPSGDFAAFRGIGVMQPADLALVPLHRVYHEHYAAYFPLYTPADWAARRNETRRENALLLDMLDAATLDRVEIAVQQSEFEHGFDSDRSLSGNQGRKWRDALSDGGWFSYRMTVDPEKDLALLSTHWGGDRGREYEIWIDDHCIPVRLHEGEENDFFDAAYPIPRDIIKGKSHVIVRLVAHVGRAGAFGLRIVEASAVTDAQWREGRR